MSSATALVEPGGGAPQAASRRLAAWRLFGTTRVRVGAALTLAIVVLALAGPLFAPDSPTVFVGPAFQGPSSDALLGTDNLGRDVLSRVMWGGRNILWMALTATTLGVVLGACIGLIAGYSRSRLDDVLMRIMDVPYAFPQVVLVLLFVSLLGPKLWLIVLLVAIGWTPQVARVVRGATLEVVGREFVAAADALGVPKRRVLSREILPNVTTPLLVEYGQRLTWAIAIIAGLSFLGFGVQAPTADWGLMINENRSGLTLNAWSVVAPVTCVAIFTIGLNLMTDGFARVVAGIDRRDETDADPGG
jgi:peptide/nickel transport system permease protein